MIRKLAPLCAIAGIALATAPVHATTTFGSGFSGTATETFSLTQFAYAADVSSSDLINGMTPTVVLANWNTTNNAHPNELTDGIHGIGYNIITTDKVQGAWTKTNVSTAIYNLGTGTGGQGFDITSIQSIADWVNVGFGNQAWMIEVKPVGGSYSILATVNYQPLNNPVANNNIGTTKVTLSNLDATGIESIRITSNSVNNGANAGAFVWREFDVFGTETLDVIPPQITAVDPAGSGIYPGAGLVATFDEDIALTGGGSITLVDTGDGSDTVVINVTDPSQVAVAGSKLTINPPANLAFNTPFEVVIGNNTIQDSAPAPNAYPGTASGRWTFTTAAEQFSASVILSRNPDDEASRVSITGNLVATFSQDILAGSGDIVILDTADGSTTRTIAVTDSTQISISGHVLTINPAAMLGGGRSYAIQIAPGAVKNYSDLAFAGITNATDWNFSTVPFVINNFADGSDAATGISTAKTYTHLVDFGKDADTAVINGVSFGNPLGIYTISSLNTYTAANPLNGASPGTGMRHLLDHFRYGYNGVNPPTLTLSGLTPGASYRLRLYVSGWGTSPQTFSFDDTAPATVVSGIPRSAGQDLPSSFDYTYTLGAGDTDLTVIITPEIGNDSFHWYGFSNEEVGGNTFADWIANYPGVGAQTGVDQDPDGDGIDNGAENYFGTDPSNFSRGIVAGGVSGNTFTFTHPISATPAEDLAAIYRWTTNLQDFYQDGSPNGAGTTTVSFSQAPPSGGQVTVTATISGSIIPERLFVDVRVN